MDGWTDGWMGGWKDERMGGRREGWMDRYLSLSHAGLCTAGTRFAPGHSCPSRQLYLTINATVVSEVTRYQTHHQAQSCCNSYTGRTIKGKRVWHSVTHKGTDFSSTSTQVRATIWTKPCPNWLLHLASGCRTIRATTTAPADAALVCSLLCLLYWPG
jgi:hypothetical protein